MCGYISQALKNDLNKARAARSTEAKHEAGKVYGVVFHYKTGRLSRPAQHLKDLSFAEAVRWRAMVAGWNPKATVVVVDLRTGKQVELAI